VRISQGDAFVALAAADAGLIKSGTSTLEAGLMRCPHAVVYKASALTTWIFKNFVKYQGPVGLVNLALGWKPGDPYLVKELLSEQVTASHLSAELVSLFQDSERRDRMRAGFEILRQEILVPGLKPSSRVAEEIVAEIFRGTNVSPA
jgi:lipid-A-disaccharide synthase